LLNHFLRMLNNKKTGGIVYVAEVICFFLVISGLIPREFVLYLVAMLALYLILAPLEDGVIFFAASIPMFLAIPFSSSFDNFNSWRIFSVILFVKWFLSRLKTTKIFTKGAFVQWRPLYAMALVALYALMLLSVSMASDKAAAIKRIIYFTNLSLVGFPVYYLTTRSSDFSKRLIRALTIPVLLVTIIGFLQLASSYFIDIYQFMRIWGENIQCNQFGQQWCDIAVRVGNTWFAYYGEQLSLRMFSLFPDSHSFPIFLLLGMPAIFAWTMRKMDVGAKFQDLIKTRTKLFVVWVPIIFLAVILTGTRGFWAASVGVVALAIGVIIYMTIKKETKVSYFKFISSYIILFFMMFFVAITKHAPIPFLLSKGDWSMLGNRIRSVIDFGETSNAQRIEIWKKSLVSIADHPLLGVGIGNYPVVLSQDIKLSKAGSSAHNIYLHVAAEMGVFALIALCAFLFELFKIIYRKFIDSKADTTLATYYGASLLFIPWVFAYLMTDVAIFDERAFLMLAVSAALLVNKGPD